MPRDYYEVLGIPRDASEDQIRNAHRKLARQFHPDRNPGDKQAEASFKEAQEAYDVLSDKEKRAQFDQFGTAGPQAGFGGFGAGGGPGGSSFRWGGGPGGGGAEMDPEMAAGIFRQFFGGGGPGGDAGGDPGDLGDLFGGRAAKGRRRARPQPEDVEHEVAIPFLTAALGGKVALRVNEREIEVKIPAGIADGKSLRLQGQAPGGGDIRLMIRVQPHPYFTREGNDVILKVPLSLVEAALGASVDVPTLDGTRLTVKVPPGTSSNGRLRLRGKGIAGGDQYIEMQIVAPAVKEGRGRELLEEFAKLHPQTPRAGLPWV